MRVLMVCLGNICRSPTAEAVLRAKLEAAGLAGRVEVDSAGTGSWHVGSPPDARSQRHAAQRGYDLSALRARRVAEDDFHHFDLIRRAPRGVAPVRSHRSARPVHQRRGRIRAGAGSGRSRQRRLGRRPRCAIGNFLTGIRPNQSDCR
jgi:protein-tyrosine phosphatase